MAGNIRSHRWWQDRGFIRFVSYVVLLSILSREAIGSLIRHAAAKELHSHILLIPFVVGYLASLHRDELPVFHRGSRVGAFVLTLAAGILYLYPINVGISDWSINDQLARSVACYVLLLVAGGFLFLGTPWMRVLAFPFCILLLLVPLPDLAAAWLEDFLMRGSAVLAEWSFSLAGTPVYRTGQVIQLPGTTLEVARECSGIRSTLVLFITSLMLAQLILRRPWHRALLVALVIPIGILRNAFRVFVIGSLCVHVGPQMIDSWIHHHGGPVFFAVTLAPLLILAAWMRHRERENPVG